VAIAVAAAVTLLLATGLTFLVECPALHAIRRKYKSLRDRAPALARSTVTSA
jgi:hypothetical protein